MSQQLIVVAESIAKPGHEDELRALLLTLIEPSRAEPGCVQYTLHEIPPTPVSFYFTKSGKTKQLLSTTLKPSTLLSLDRRWPIFARLPHRYGNSR